MTKHENDTLDVVGSFWTSSSTLYHYGWGKRGDLPKYNETMPIFSVKGAAMLIKKDLVDRIGLFDEEFWCYYEETDFCHRVWLAGYECWYFPKTICYHAGGGTTSVFDDNFVQFHNYKNKLASFIKNFEVVNLVKIIPTFLVLTIGVSFVWLLSGKLKHFWSMYQALWWNVKCFPETLRKRKTIQTLRKKSDKELFKTIKKNPRMSYYYYLFKGVHLYKD